MTENEHTRELVAEIRKRLPHGVAWKHTDLATAGIPDLSVTYRARTIWAEAKLIDEDRYLRPCQLGRHCVEVIPRLHVPGLQWEELRKLGNGYLVIYTPLGHALTHVNGYRQTVERLHLRLSPLEAVARQVVDLVKRRDGE